MKSYRILYIIFTVLSLCICFNGVLSAMGVSPKPLDYNLLLITIDTIRADHLGCYGYKYIKTPNIDKLASEGVLFYNAFTPVPITLPSHSSMMTGLYPVQHGVRNNGTFFLDKGATTLAEIMKGHRYQTGACVGSFVLDSLFGLDQGFDYYDDHFTPGKKRVNMLYNERNAGEINRIAIQWLEKQKDNRFFLWLHYFDPHSPYFPPFPFSLDYRACLYDGEIAYVDKCLGELFSQMNEMGLINKTIIFLVGDHG
ncbi:MAG: sulfatase, partial [bacterium]